MAVIYDNSDVRFGLGSSVSFSYTVTGSATAILVWAAEDPNGGGGTITNVSYAGTNLDNYGSSGQMRALAKQGVATGPNTLTFTRSSYGGLAFNTSSFAGVDSVTPFGAVVFNTGATSSPSTGSITCPSGGMIWGAEFSSYTTAPAPSITSGTLGASVRSTGSGQTLATGYGSTTGAISWALGSAPGSWSAVGFPINPTGAGADTFLGQICL